ncbi:hypothetical protein F2Q70_00023987 [Brassica cretica]|uniref:Uncharacterized protein n=1 Tax=Brassica cretica TaxID=69181 RepID=A0A8S9GQD1_BRACR|nr:hypothetical protein F2Q70_00023987 [Brassica cretica]
MKPMEKEVMMDVVAGTMVLKGTPMMLMGDEYRHTRYGNNNSYGHDTALNNFHWKEASLNILLLLLILP